MQGRANPPFAVAFRAMDNKPRIHREQVELYVNEFIEKNVRGPVPQMIFRTRMLNVCSNSEGRIGLQELRGVLLHHYKDFERLYKDKLMQLGI